MEARVSTLQDVIKCHRSAANLLNLLDALENLVLDLDFPSLCENKSFGMILKTYKEFKNDLGEVQKKTELFKKIKFVGKGTFGQVHMVRHKTSYQVFAMKSLNKSTVKGTFWQERDIMILTQSPWLVQLCCSFQDDSYLYMVMDYMPGGDLSMLIKQGCMSEDMAKFYIAEVVLALEALHSMCYIHYDVKPKNMLLDQNSHVKLADFGVSIKTDSIGMAYSVVAGGTPLYMAPEVVELNENGGWLDRDCDWWSVGVVLYEMLIGQTPFASHSLLLVLKKIKNYKDYLKFPKDKTISEEARDIICGFLTDSMDRLGSIEMDDIKQHPFFRNDNWTFNTIQQTAAPIVPELYRQIHCDGDHINTLPPTEEEPFRGDQIKFFGFTYFNDKKLYSLLENQSCEAPSTKEKSEKDVSKLTQKMQKRPKEPSLKHAPSPFSKGEQKKKKKVHFNRTLSAQAMKEPVDARHKEENKAASRNETKKNKKERRFSFFSYLGKKINLCKKGHK